MDIYIYIKYSSTRRKKLLIICKEVRILSVLKTAVNAISSKCIPLQTTEPYIEINSLANGLDCNKIEDGTCLYKKGKLCFRNYKRITRI